MIVTPAGGGLRLVTQNDHAHFAAEILSLWVAGGLPEHPRRRQLLFAAREHDNGWREIDAAPLHDPESGRPHDFLSLPRRYRWEVWRRGTRRFAAREPYAALLVTRHARELHADRRGEGEWDEIFAEWRELEAELREETGADERTIAGDYRWIDLTDLLSLILCAGWTGRRECHGLTIEVAENVLVLDPFPLAGATTFRIPCREIPDRRFASDTDLGTELARARWRRYVVRLAPRRGALTPGPAPEGEGG